VNRIFLLSLLVFVLAFFGLAIGNPLIVVLALPLVLYLFTGLWRAPGKIKLDVARTLSAQRIQIGDELTVEVTVRNQAQALEAILLDDHIPEGLEVTDGSKCHLVTLDQGEAVSWTYTLQGRRGYYGLKKITAIASDALEVVSEVEEITTNGQLFILPPVLRLKNIAIRPRRTRIFSGTIPANQGGSGVEFFDVREYQQGDPPRWINWRAIARHPQNVFVKEFEQERSADVGLILDGRRRSNNYQGRSLFEHSVLATAAMADAFLNAGNRVGLLFYGRQLIWTMPGYGKLQGERILHDLSQLEPGESENFNELYIPRHLFPSRSQLVLVSPLTPEDYDALAALRMKGYQLLVVSPDPVAFEVTGLPPDRSVMLAARIVRIQREIMLRRLRGMGVHVVDWDTSLPFEQVAKRELERHVVLPRGELR
jgi:uncharacterized protein (DUF58 family)